MSEKTIAGYCVKCNDQGFMENLAEWNKEIAFDKKIQYPFVVIEIKPLIRAIKKLVNNKNRVKRKNP